MKFRISAISFAELREYAVARSRDPEGILPITPERAASQQQNPHAGERDPCLWVAEDAEGKVIGFAGSLPGMEPRSGTRMGWNTCWWVDPVRGKEAAMPLFYHFLRHWDRRVAFGDMTGQTRAIIDGMGFCHTRTEPLLQYYVRFPGRKLASALGPAGILLSPLIISLAFAGNTLLQVRIRRALGKGGGPAYRCMEQADEEVHAFIRRHSDSDVAQRGPEEFRWIRSLPWLVPPSRESRELDRRYPFSYVAGDYHMEWLISLEGNGIISVMLVSIRDGVLKVLYFFGPQTGAGQALEALKDYVAGHREVYTVFLSHDRLQMESERIRSISLGKRIRERRVGISRELVPDPAAFEQMVFQLGDGDAVFT